MRLSPPPLSPDADEATRGWPVWKLVLAGAWPILVLLAYAASAAWSLGY